MRKYILHILRRERGKETSYWQDFEYEACSPGDTIATALRHINSREDIRDIAGNKAGPVVWESSCNQQKCGACAMVINGIPALACAWKLSDQRKDTIKVEPLRKFPVIEDLMTDRSILRENLKTLRIWLESDAKLSERDTDMAFEASECIQCGCCLEVCPNFCCGGTFMGMNGVALFNRILTETDRADYEKAAKQYQKHIFEGCGKSLACRDICPKKIDTEKMMVNANALAVWKRRKKL